MTNLNKYNLRNLKRVASFSGIRGVSNHLGTAVNQWYYQRTNHTGFDPVSEDWDNLLILDGCRYDLFQDRIHHQGELDHRTSPASESWEYLSKCFNGRDLYDTVYVTTNPHTPKIQEGTFHTIWNLLETDFDEELQTVPPDDVATAIREALSEFPNKRIIGHFMQPHYPFIGELGREIDTSGIDPDFDTTRTGTNIWARLQYGLGVNSDEVWSAYAENLDLALDIVSDLLDDIEGKSVLTSDHGNLVGDRCRPIPTRGYGHPPNLYVEPLVKVPWFEAGYDTRRDIEAEKPVRGERLSDDVIEDRLKSLGYR
ncbi:hypothetical protein [Halobellus sp. Atlit-38R]|uniref:hypothetical protein n=1 Tax=Halobellus sp. Atlit-38R TaxID=2282131 RepID=UPI0011C40DDF|nr:hypothetical protein [Halobellus sp. Atlit-38R]